MEDIFNVSWDLLGAKFARLNSKDQAQFFRGLAAELKRFDTEYRKEMQFSYVAQDLRDSDKKELEVLSMLWFKEG